MIYITPTKFLLSDRSERLAKHFAQKELSSEQDLDDLVEKITRTVEVIRTPEDMLRVQINQSIPRDNNDLARASILTKSFPMKHQSSKLEVKMGFNCPASLERDFRLRENGSPSLRLKLAIDKYREETGINFKLNPNKPNDLKFIGHMERPIHSRKLADLESQKQRLMSQFNLYISHRVKEVVRELNPHISRELTSNNQPNRKKENFFSNQMSF